jgi:uncharacterized protein YkwD
MGTRIVCSAAVMALLVATGQGQADDQSRDRERAATLHQEFDAASFREHEEARQPIDFDDIDHALLSAAVFHETNRRRAEHGRPALGYKEELREAARVQARGMAQRDVVAHRHPAEEKRTPADRLEHVGLRAAFAAENVGMTFGIRYEEERPFVTREEDGRTVFSYTPGGEPIEPHTYSSFAESLLTGWMASESHRTNVLSPEPEWLGTGHAHGTRPPGMDVFYSVQVFYTALGSAARAPQGEWATSDQRLRGGSR